MESPEPTRRQGRIRALLFAGLAALVLATPLAFRNMPRQVTVVLERVGDRPPTDVWVWFGFQTLMDCPSEGCPIPYVSGERDLVFLHDRPSERTVWLRRGEYVVVANDGSRHEMKWNLKLGDQDRIVLRLGPDRQQPQWIH